MKNANIMVKSSEGAPATSKHKEKMNKIKNMKKQKGKGKVNMSTKVKKSKNDDTQTTKKKKGVIESHKLIVVNTSNVLKSAMDEILKDPKVNYKLQDTKAFKETQILEDFYQVLSKNSNKAAYGKKEINFAIKHSAIDKLLICSSLLRSNDFNKRKEYLKIYNQCSRQCGVNNIYVLSENHYSGQKLKEITGLAAILKFEVDCSELYNDDEEDSETSSSEDSSSSSEDEDAISEENDSGRNSMNSIDRKDLLGNSLFQPESEMNNDDVEECRKQFDQFQLPVDKKSAFFEQDFM